MFGPGIIGAGVDASNGSLNSLSPDSLDILLTPVSVPAAAAAKPAASVAIPEAAPTEAVPAEVTPTVESVPETAAAPSGE